MVNLINKKLFIRFFLAFFSLSFLTIIAYNIFQYVNVRDTLLTKTREQLWNYNERVETKIFEFWIKEQNKISILSRSINIRQFLDGNKNLFTKINENINDLLKKNAPLYDSVHILNSKGICVASTQQNTINSNHKLYSYYANAIRGKFSINFTTKMINQNSGFFISLPVYFKRKILGVVVISINNPFNKISEDAHYEDGHVIILNNIGIILSKSETIENIYHIYRFTEKQKKEIAKENIISLEKFVKSEITGLPPLLKIRDNVLLNISINNNDYFAVFKKSKIENFYTISVLKRREFFEIINFFIIRSILILAIISIFIFIVSYYFSKYFAAFFKDYALKNRELDNINKFSKEISKSHNLENVIYKIANYLKDKFGFNGIGLMLVNKDKKNYKIVKYVAPEEFNKGKKYLEKNYSLEKEGDNIARAITQKKTLFFQDLDKNNQTGNKSYEKYKINTALIVPIIVEDEAIGALVLRSHYKTINISEKDIKSIELFVNQIAVILRNVKLYIDIRQKNNELQYLNKISQKIREAMNIDSVFQQLANHFSEIYDFNGFALSLVESDRQHYIIKNFSVPEKFKRYEKVYTSIKFSLNEKGGRVAECILKNELAYYTDIDYLSLKNDLNKKAVRQLKLKTILIIPIVTENNVIGTFNLHSHFKPIHLNNEDIESIETFINQFAVMMSNVMLYEEIKIKSDELLKAHNVLKQTNKELEETLEIARRANKTKSTFLTLMSHELRTPLSGILGFSEILLKDKSLNETQREYSDIIFNSSNRLMQILNDLLLITNLETGDVFIEYSKFDIKKVIDDVYILLKTDFSKKNLFFKIETNELNEIYSDEVRIRQILFNLIGNAVKFTASGGISINVEILYNKYKFVIVDTGIGIKSEISNDVFDMFKQSEKLENRKYGGTGLGLAICKRLIEALNGEIWYESTEGKGSTFYFTVPIVKEKKQ